MEFFRSDEGYTQLTPDDCVELFQQSLKGSTDLTEELLERVISDYGGNLIVRVEQEAQEIKEPAKRHYASMTPDEARSWLMRKDKEAADLWCAAGPDNLVEAVGDNLRDFGDDDEVTL